MAWKLSDVAALVKATLQRVSRLDAPEACQVGVRHALRTLVLQAALSEAVQGVRFYAGGRRTLYAARAVLIAQPTRSCL